MTTIAQWLAACPLPKNEARMLLQHQTGFSRSQLITRDGDALSAADLSALDALAARRLAGEPMAYILGRREFYGRRFAVSPAVLIPRPETEHLLEAALQALPAGGSLWDLGTGSGIIAVSAKLERPDARVRASDISAEALAVARNNARTLGAAIEWALGSWFDAAVQDNSPFRLPENSRFDVIVSNPPYIEAGDAHLAAGDLRFEPQGALTDFADGLSCIRAIAAGARQHLKSGGRLLFEHGYNQGAAVREILAAAGFTDIATQTDLAGLDRVTSAQAA